MLQVQTPVAVVDTNVQRRSSKTKAATIKAAHAFVDYLYSPGAQADFAAAGFRYVCICACACEMDNILLKSGCIIWGSLMPSGGAMLPQSGLSQVFSPFLGRMVSAHLIKAEGLFNTGSTGPDSCR